MTGDPTALHALGTMLSSSSAAPSAAEVLHARYAGRLPAAPENTHVLSDA
ncbi:hypothetical protein ABZV29_41425 [Streptomyces sp. NPDC005236]